MSAKHTPTPLALAIQEAWKKYYELFGVTVNGTLPQIEAMLELLPDKSIVRAVNSHEALLELARDLAKYAPYSLEQRAQTIIAKAKEKP